VQRLFKGYVIPVLGLVIIVLVVYMKWEEISKNANTLSALSTVVSVLIAVFALFFILWQTKAANRQAEAAEKTLLEMQEERRSSSRPILIPVGGPDVLEAGSMLVDDSLKPRGTLSVDNDGLGPALNVVVRVFIKEEQTLFETDLSFVATGAKGIQVDRKNWGGFGKPLVTGYTHMFEAVYDDVHNRQHRTMALWQNGQWTQLRFDNGGDKATGKFGA
jgi:type II secretory pathway pseudopilin PulG